MALDPHRAMGMRVDIAAGSPDILEAVPVPMTGLPHPDGGAGGRRWDDLGLRCGNDRRRAACARRWRGWHARWWRGRRAHLRHAGGDAGAKGRKHRGHPRHTPKRVNHAEAPRRHQILAGYRRGASPPCPLSRGQRQCPGTQPQAPLGRSAQWPSTHSAVRWGRSTKWPGTQSQSCPSQCQWPRSHTTASARPDGGGGTTS
jgi:hypothetical protein